MLIDEFSSGVDAKMKRDMWGTLRGVAAGKAVVITTRTHRSKLSSAFLIFNSASHHADSMEEASALASKVGILAKRMLGASFILVIDVLLMTVPMSSGGHHCRSRSALRDIRSPFLMPHTRRRRTRRDADGAHRRRAAGR